MGKKKKSHKKKDRKKHKKHRSRSESVSSQESKSTRSSRSSSRSSNDTKAKPVVHKSAKDMFNEYLGKNSDLNWHLAQKSETLLFEADAEPEKTETFVWRKKNQKIGLDKLDPEKVLLLNKLKQEETARELEKLKRRKIEREREREQREHERDFEQRQKEVEYHKEWEKQEDSFHLKQVKLRSQIRIKEGRAKPIDLLAKYINAEEDDLAIEMHEPYMYLNGLTIRDLEDLLVDIRVYSDLEQGANADYWKDIRIITEDELKKLQKLDKNSREHAGDRREGINQSVLQDVASLFRGKTYDQLVKLEESINKKIKEETGIDIGYWESLLSQLKAHMARARLRDRHQKVLQEKLNCLKKQQGLDKKSTENESDFDRKIRERIAKEEENMRNKSDDTVEKKKSSKEMAVDDKSDHEQNNNGDDDNDDENEEDIELEKLAILEYEEGNFSPVLIRQEDLPFDTFIITQEEDEKRLEFQRKQVIGTGSVKPDLEDAFEKKARDTMGGIIPSTINDKDGSGVADGADEDEDAESMTASALTAKLTNDEDSGAKQKSNTVEMPVEHHYLWSDKYRPRKPRYYNRVHTGYDWNQYNKKHYDYDNPPPKTVQGYKFNIFYPDLIDKTKTPCYSILPCPENKEFSILKFSSGAPYEDVAFKIVNKEWDISHRHGFRNQFQNGIYQLWFHFRRWKYRR